MKMTPTSKALVVAVLACAPLGCGTHKLATDGGAGDGPSDAPVATTTRLLLAPTDTLSGGGRTACSHQEPASGDGDRWCAFRRPHTGGGTELWVIDVSAAARGSIPTCDGTDPACRLLTTTLWPSYGNDFLGDTLVIYADAPDGLTPSQAFVGPVSVWRPGWSKPRLIAQQATVCTAHVAAPVAVCLDEPRGNTNNPDDVRLRAGELADKDGLLTAMPGRWPFRSDGSIPWQLGFTPDGKTFAVSVPDVTPFVQNLSVIATRDIGKAEPSRNVVSDLTMWTISNDGSKIFYYRGPKTDATLLMADFPAGTGEKTLATKVVEFVPLGRNPADAALLLRVQQPGGGQAFRLLRDRARPETAQTVFTIEGFLEGIVVSPDLRYTAWIDPDFRGSVIRVEDLATCAINAAPAPEVGELAFLGDSSYLLWSQPGDAGHSYRDGYLATPDACTAGTRYAVKLGFVAPVGGRGLVFGDEHDDSARTVTLRYASLAGGVEQAAAGGVRIHEGVTFPVALVSDLTGAGSTHVVYAAEAGAGGGAGTYIYGPLPF